MTPNHLGTMLSPVDQARADAYHSLMQMIRAIRTGKPPMYWYQRARASVRGYRELENEFEAVWPRAKFWAQLELDHKNANRRDP